MSFKLPSLEQNSRLRKMLQWRSLLDGTTPSAVPASLHCFGREGKRRKLSVKISPSESNFAIAIVNGRRERRRLERSGDGRANPRKTLLTVRTPTITVDDVQQQFQVVLGLLHQVPRLRKETRDISEMSVSYHMTCPPVSSFPSLNREAAQLDNTIRTQHSGKGQAGGWGGHLVLCPVNVQVASKARRDCQRSVHVVLWSERHISRAKRQRCRSGT